MEIPYNHVWFWVSVLGLTMMVMTSMHIAYSVAVRLGTKLGQMRKPNTTQK